MFLSAHDHASSVIIIYLRIYEHVYHSVQMGCRIWDDAAHLSHVPMIWINNLFNEFERECGWMSRYFLFWNPFPFHMHIFLFSFYFRLLLLLFNRSRYDAVLEAYWKSSRVKKKIARFAVFLCVYSSLCVRRTHYKLLFRKSLPDYYYFLLAVLLFSIFHTGEA